MFSNHVYKKLLAYCHGQLPPAESERVGGHLLKCARCRKEYDEIKFAVGLAEHLPQVTAPASLWGEIESLLEQESQKERSQKRPSYQESPWRIFRPGWIGVAAASAAILLVAAAGAVWYLNYGPKASWEVARWSNGVERKGRVAVGEAVETDGGSRALIEVGEIGQVELEPNTRIRLVQAHMTEHRLALDRGTMHATISAPPRLFFVDTPSAEAIDLGCAYTLEVDAAGRAFLHVTSGWVELVGGGHRSYVPIRAMCETRPGTGPGTPYFESASDKFRDALERFDFENGGEPALDVVLAESRDQDTFTLWHLLSRVDERERGRVLDVMIDLVGLPQGVTREGVMRLDEEMLELWKNSLDTIWFQ
jgi:hypothetical protein